MAVVVIGSSVAGLASALALSDLGHEVQLLERDPQLPPGSVELAHSDWRRPTAPQALHSHAFASLGCNILRERAPQVYAAMVKAGALEIRLGDSLPPTLSDRSPELGDEQLRMLGCRRSTYEWVLRRETLSRPGISVEPGVTVRGLRFARSDARRVVGVEAEGGRSFDADLVIDASGRRSAVGRWLGDAGVPVADDTVSSCEITYYTRYYRLLADHPPGPLNRGFGAGGLWDHYTAVLFLGDSGTFSISIGVLPEDTRMKALREEEAFTAAVRATPLLAPWLAPGASEPISEVYAMGGLDNSLRGLATTRQEPVIGLHCIGDSVCTTNPAYGRGVSLALAHAWQLADILAAHPEPGREQAREQAAATERLFLPWLNEAILNDRGRAGLWRAGTNGGPLPRPPKGVLTFGTVVAAAGVDPVVWRRVANVMMMLADPASLYGDPEIAERVGKVLAAGPPAQIPGASREDLVSAVAPA